MSDELVRVIISVRVSSEDQKEKGWGHADQLATLPLLAAAQGWELATRPDGSPAIYDEGAASTTALPEDELGLISRPVLASLIGELEHTRPTYLVCRKLDRLHRNNLQYEYLASKLMGAGVTGFAQFPAMRGGPEIREVGDPRSRAMASMEATFASLEKAELKEKLMAARRRRAAAGLPNGGRTPYGYRRTHDKRAPFEVVPAEKETYLRLIDWAIAGHGPAYMAHQLVRDGVPARSGTSNWSATTVRKLLENESQTGMVRVSFDGKNAWVEGGHEPLVARERWETARAVLSSRKRESGSNQKRHALAGLLRCSACGATLKARVTRKPKKSGGTYEYWGYSCKVYNSGCTAGYYISENKALDELAVLIDARLNATEEWVEPTPVDDVSPLRERVEALTVSEADALRAYERAAARYEQAPDELLYEASLRLNDRERDLVEVRDELGQARAALAGAVAMPSAAVVRLEELRDVLSGWRDFDDDNDKRALLEAVIDHATLLPPGRSRRLEVAWND
jgi:DNA invertase Pin-like site-specific DNA recombinase